MSRGHVGGVLERESQLAALFDYAEEARRGDGRLVLVSGEAGIGKSTLVEQLEADLVDASWWWGACDGMSTPRPLGPLGDIANQAGGRLRAVCDAQASRDVRFDAFLAALGDTTQLRALGRGTGAGARGVVDAGVTDQPVDLAHHCGPGHCPPRRS